MELYFAQIPRWGLDMNLRRGLFRLWIVGSALFVLAVAFVNYSEIKKQFNDIAIQAVR